jgi:hypothetical protein
MPVALARLRHPLLLAPLLQLKQDGTDVVAGMLQFINTQKLATNKPPPGSVPHPATCKGQAAGQMKWVQPSGEQASQLACAGPSCRARLLLVLLSVCGARGDGAAAQTDAICGRCAACAALAVSSDTGAGLLSRSGASVGTIASVLTARLPPRTHPRSLDSSQAQGSRGRAQRTRSRASSPQTPPSTGACVGSSAAPTLHIHVHTPAAVEERYSRGACSWRVQRACAPAGPHAAAAKFASGGVLLTTCAAAVATPTAAASSCA